MNFGLADEFLQGKGRKGTQSYNDLIIPGCFKEYEETNLVAARDNGTLNQTEFVEGYRAVVSKLTPSRTPKCQLELPLPGSGEVMVQHSHALSHYYLHMVEAWLGW
ncbi:Uu.00g115480.m01.CDS01 [Anthostomella pinea]|uniref:Uu.00g115480.m01.CDS01 n=1 Tax=Anthostomella pinea TaxID=933095 RepID=A0AAI8YGR0_9PEZI|nr:Uu.00g115480.m01.CDS01 [Anthostomella pinea]